MKCIVPLLALVVVAGLVRTPLRADDKPEPRYEGKSLDYWVTRLRTCETYDQQRDARNAIVAFGADATPAIPALIEMLDDRSVRFRSEVCDILSSLGRDVKPVVPALVRLLKEKKARDPKQVLACLGDIGPAAAEAVPELIKTLKDEELNSYAIDTLAKIGPAAKDAVPALLKVVKSDDRDRRADAAEALWLIEQHPIGLSVLAEPLLDKRNESIDVWHAASVLGKSGAKGKSALPILKKAYEDRLHPEPGRSVDRDNLEKIAEAIKNIDPEEAKKLKPY